MKNKKVIATDGLGFIGSNLVERLIAENEVTRGMDEETTDVLAELYDLITTVFKPRDIQTAEAAKVIENIQRDLNIALMNELVLIFERMNIDIMDVIEAAATKWNFNVYYPGAGVGGTCLPVDPYYLVKKALGAGVSFEGYYGGQGC